VVDLGTLEWAHSGSDPGYWVSTGIKNVAKKVATNSQTPNSICSTYNVSSPNDAISIIDTVSINTDGNIVANTGSTTEPPSGWLVYELATPVVTTFSEEISTTARISDYGTEECIPVNGYTPITAPFRGIVLYQDDYARTITKLPENYQSQDSMDNLLALLGQLHNGIIKAKFDSANQVYTYQFIPNA
jgi:hypothetical protein